MLLAPIFPLTPAGYFAAMVHRMLIWLTLRVQRADQGYQPSLSSHVRAQTKAIHDRVVVAGRMFARLAELARTGMLRSYPNRASPRPRAPDAAIAAASCIVVRDHVQASRGPGWMLDFVPADFAEHLARLLRITDVVTLIQTAPPVARLLRPLCRGLGVVPPPGVFPPLPRRARRLTPDAGPMLPDASVPEHRRGRVTEAAAGVWRRPRPWGDADVHRAAPRWAPASARRDHANQTPD